MLMQTIPLKCRIYVCYTRWFGTDFSTGPKYTRGACLVKFTCPSIVEAAGALRTRTTCWMGPSRHFCHPALYSHRPGNILIPRQNGGHFADDIFTYIFVFLYKNVVFWLKCHWHLFPRIDTLTIFQHCFRPWLAAEPATNHFSVVPVHRMIHVWEILFRFE